MFLADDSCYSIFSGRRKLSKIEESYMYSDGVSDQFGCSFTKKLEWLYGNNIDLMELRHYIRGMINNYEIKDNKNDFVIHLDIDNNEYINFVSYINKFGFSEKDFNCIQEYKKYKTFNLINFEAARLLGWLYYDNYEIFNLERYKIFLNYFSRFFNIDKFMDITLSVGELSKCHRFKYGTIIIDSNNRIISTGVNFHPQKTTHDNICIRNELNVKSGENKEIGYCIHSEMNALMFGDFNSMRNGSIFITGEPCLDCIRHIMQFSFKHIIFLINQNNPKYGGIRLFYELGHKNTSVVPLLKSQIDINFYSG